MEAQGSGGNLTGDAGVLLLRQVDSHLDLAVSIARLPAAPRRQTGCGHAVLSMPRQRVYGLTAGYPDLNDYDFQLHRCWRAINATAFPFKNIEGGPSRNIKTPCNDESGWRTGSTTGCITVG